jgi:hypothetical protein
MSTRKPTTRDGQSQLGDYSPGVYEFSRGDLLEVTQNGTGSKKVRLRECPFCAADPERERHHFAAQESPASHVHNEHDWGELSIASGGLLQRKQRVSGD